MNELALFAGAGGGILAGKLLGWTPVCAVEINRHCQDSLLQRQRDGILPPFPIWSDICTFDGRPWSGIVDVVSGGFPCQDISFAGDGEGIAGERSGLWKEMFRIIREVGPGVVFVENVAALTSRGLDVVLSDLAAMGFDANWGVLGGSYTRNVAEGERLWIVASQAHGAMLESVDLSQHLKPCSQKSCRRQFARAVGEMLRTDDYTELKRDSDAVAAGMEQLKAIGNGQNPAVAAAAFRVLSQGLVPG